MAAQERKVDVKLALRAYQHVVDHGVRDNGGYVHQGLHASTDPDGYSIALSDGTVTLRILFHHGFVLEPPQGKAIDRFLTRLARAGKRR